MSPTRHIIRLGRRRVEYRVLSSRAARRLHLRVGPRGVEVVRPSGRSAEDVRAFVEGQSPWVLEQLRRVERLREIRRPPETRVGWILYLGVRTRVRVERAHSRARYNLVRMEGGEIIIRRGDNAQTPASQSLETWLRKRARDALSSELAAITARLRQKPSRVYVMGQRTKWGNCSARRNLSFNWRVILAPDFVLRYLATHEVVHLSVPDHSQRFWLTVQSICPETQKARTWLRAHEAELRANLGVALGEE